jgi:hypothetical protein
MSLLNDFREKCVMMDRTTTADGYGGYVAHWNEGAEIDAVIVLDTSMQARQAEKDGVTALYTITTGKTVNLQYHDVIKRVRDGKVFRITSDGDDKHTPDSATLNMRQTTAEEWTIPTGGNND